MADDRQFRPLPGDPDGVTVEAMFDARNADWILATDGDYQTAAVETMQADGSAHQTCVALEWPGRRNHSDEQVTVRLLISPEDAIGLAQVLAHTGLWLREHASGGGG